MELENGLIGADMNPDWINGLLGGALIGAGSGVLLLGNGRIAGISGILGAIVESPFSRQTTERLLFVAGLMIVPLVYFLVKGPPDYEMTSNVTVLVIAGLLTGIGTRLGNGCTSGHGICGLSRFSTRSLVAVLTFMATGVLAVTALSFLGL